MSDAWSPDIPDDPISRGLEEELARAQSETDRLDVLVRLSKRLSGINNDRSAELAGEAIDLAALLGDTEALAYAWRNLAEANLYGGRLEDGLTATYDGEEAARASGNPAHLASLIAGRAFVLGSAGAFEEALTLLDEARRMLGEPSTTLAWEVLSFIHVCGGYFASIRNDFEEMVQESEKAIDAARHIPDYVGLPGMLANYATALQRRGDLERSLALAREAEEVVERLKLGGRWKLSVEMARLFAATVLGLEPDGAQLLVERYESGFAALESGRIDAIQVLGGTANAFPAVVAHLEHFEGEYERLSEIARASITVARENDLPSFLPVLCESAADLARAQGNRDDEANLLRQAIDAERMLGLQAAKSRSELARMTREVEARFELARIEHERNEELTRLNEDLEYERDRIDALLYNTLPGPVVDLLKSGATTIAEHVRDASVMFVDVVGSTPLFAQLEPARVVEWMNDVFSRLDHLVERHGAEKIRTIGDGYMVAAGVPKRQPDHAAVLCELALDMIEELRHVPARNGRRVEVRIGINSGPLVAGVIGRRRYQYDLWGETVTLASRMESHGEPGKVHISEATYAHVRDRFVCESRGRIPVKGIGEIDTWYIARAPATDSDAGAIA